MEVSEIIDNFDRRIHDVEQALTSAAVMGGQFPGGVVIGDGPGAVAIDATPPGAVTDIIVTPGAIYNNIYVDVEWERAISGNFAGMFDVELVLGADGLGTLVAAVQTGGTSYRFENLLPATDYSVRVTPASNIGIRGPNSAWINFTSVADSTIPPAPTGVSVARGATTAVVIFTPLTTEQAPDVANGQGLYEVEIDIFNTFTSPYKMTQRTGDQVVAFDGLNDPVSWYARVRAIDSSGNFSLWSAIAGPALAGGVVDAMIVADLSAAKITAGFLSASRIQTGSLVADKLATSTLSATTITVAGSGQIFCGAWPTGVLMNASGLRLYKNGIPTVTMDSFTGDASFSGTINASAVIGSTIFGGAIIGAGFYTAFGGARVEMATGGYSSFYRASPAIQFWPNAIYGIDKPAGMFCYTGPDNEVPAPTLTLRLQSPEYTGWNNGSSLSLISDSGGNQGVVRVFADHFTVVGGAKDFLIPHPSPGKERFMLRHSAIEGPEVGVYYRGIGKLENGRASVLLPEYFKDLVVAGSQTVLLTSIVDRDGPDLLGAGVVIGNEFSVMSDDSTSSKSFYWEVKAVRKTPTQFVVEEEQEGEEIEQFIARTRERERAGSNRQDPVVPARPAFQKVLGGG